MAKEMKDFLKATVTQNYSHAKGIFYLELSFPVEVYPGQFVMLRPLDPYFKHTPRPISMHSNRNGKLGLVIRNVGPNTKLYSELKPEDEIFVSGPHGQSFVPNPQVKKYMLVGGGMGFAPLAPICDELIYFGKKVDVILGAKTDEELCSCDFFLKARLKTTHEGKKKNKFVTDLLAIELKKKKHAKTVVIACGPRPMLKKVAEMCKESGNECLVMVEEMMACGIGSCMGCAIFMDKGKTVLKVCKDGPIFDAKRICWEQFVPTSISVLSRVTPGNVDPFATILRGQDGRKLPLHSPIMNGAGCLGPEAAANREVDLDCAGAVVAKGVRLLPKLGNPTPRICETENGMLNAIGLQTDGVEDFISHLYPLWKSLGIPIIVNIFGDSIADYVNVIRRIEDSGIEVDGYEENISCPNIKKGGQLFGIEPKMIFKITSACRKVTDKFLIVKHTPNVTYIAPNVKASEDAGADAVSLINTVGGMDVDIWTSKPTIANVIGGYSGPGILPIALKMVYQAAQVVKIPIIGMGGIKTAEDAAKFFIVGASAIGVGTALFTKRRVMNDIMLGLWDIAKARGGHHILDLKGTLIK